MLHFIKNHFLLSHSVAHSTVALAYVVHCFLTVTSAQNDSRNFHIVCMYVYMCVSGSKTASM